jgi:ABC-type uncharacterized transport system permease subunit
MKSADFVQRAERDARIVQALHLARYLLVTHHALTVRAEGEQWQLDFTRGIHTLTDALELMGIDTSNGLPAPMRPGDEDDA